MSSLRTQLRKYLKEYNPKEYKWETVVVDEKDYNSFDRPECDYLIIIDIYGEE